MLYCYLALLFPLCLVTIWSELSMMRKKKSCAAKVISVMFLRALNLCKLLYFIVFFLFFFCLMRVTFNLMIVAISCTVPNSKDKNQESIEWLTSNVVTRFFRHQSYSRRGGRRSCGRAESFVILWRGSSSCNVLWEPSAQLHQGSERQGVSRRCVSRDSGSLTCVIIVWMDIFGSAFLLWMTSIICT